MYINILESLVLEDVDDEAGPLTSPDSAITNERIRQEFIDSLKQQRLLLPVLPQIELLVKRGELVPVSVKKENLDKVKNVFKQSTAIFSSSDYLVGFYDPASGKIYILVENITSKNYWNKDASLSLVVLHELQHYCSKKFPNSFISINRDSLHAYYLKFFELYFGVKVEDETKIDFVIKFLHANVEKLNDIPGDFLDKYNKVLSYVVLPYATDKQTTEEDILKLLHLIKLYIESPVKYFQELSNRDPREWKLFTSLYNSYRAIKIVKVYSLCIQEILVPGEIIATESEYNTNRRHFALIQKIK
jgi:hypothetical protein